MKFLHPSVQAEWAKCTGPTIPASIGISEARRAIIGFGRVSAV